jgi:hypothetical protein
MNWKQAKTTNNSVGIPQLLETNEGKIKICGKYRAGNSKICIKTFSLTPNLCIFRTATPKNPIDSDSWKAK